MVGYRIVPISELSAKQIMAIAQIHTFIMDSLLSEMGLLVVERYYQIACADTSVIGCCAVSQSGFPLGWAIGSSAPSGLNERLRTALGWGPLIPSLIKSPRLIWQIIISSRTASAPMKPGSVELTYIGVDTPSRGKGIARDLLNVFLAQAQARGFQSVALSVDDKNLAARTLYIQVGFRVAASFREGRYNRLRMEMTF